MTYEQAGRLELAEQERDEIEVIREFMPKQLNEDEITAACQKVVQDLDADGLKDMGRTMGGAQGALFRTDGLRQGEQDREGAAQLAPVSDFHKFSTA